MNDLDGVLAASHPVYDIASSADHERVRRLADSLLAGGLSHPELNELGNDRSKNLDLRVATRIAASKKRLIDTRPSMSVAVVMAMWGEQRRLRPPGGERRSRP